MSSRIANSTPKHNFDTQIKAAVRVAHLMLDENHSSDADLLMLVIASRRVEESKDMHQAMALAACAAQKSKHPM